MTTSAKKANQTHAHSNSRTGARVHSLVKSAQKKAGLTLVKGKEGPVAKAIETQTSKWPSDLFLWAAAGSIVTSAALQFRKRQFLSLFLGEWAPTFLLLGVYNKLVKVLGSERRSKTA